MEAVMQREPYQDPPMAPAEESIITETPASTAVHCVVFVGDFLTDVQRQSPLYRLGGRLFPYPHVQTVPNGIVRRCEITRLKPKMRGVHKQNIPEDKWALWTDTYTLTNQWDKKQQRFVNLTLGNTPDTADLLYKPLQPSQEIGMIAYREQDGVIHLTGAAQLNTADEIKAAQLFVFPEWSRVLTGQSKLPLRIAELEEYFEGRRAVAPTPTLQAVCDAYLASCAQFREKAREYIDRQTAAIEETKGKGVSVRYDNVAERLFVMCDITREDRMVTNFAQTQADAAKKDDQIATAITLMSQILEKTGASLPNASPAAQPPAPTTEAEATAEMERAADEELFVDMTAATMPEVAIAPEVSDEDKLAQARARFGISDTPDLDTEPAPNVSPDVNQAPVSSLEDMESALDEAE